LIERRTPFVPAIGGRPEGLWSPGDHNPSASEGASRKAFVLSPFLQGLLEREQSNDDETSFDIETLELIVGLPAQGFPSSLAGSCSACCARACSLWVSAC
jgi:hypothetical protein